MQSNIPRAAIHVGKDKKSFSAQVGNEAECRGWDENVYRLKNGDKEKNNHYNFSRKEHNFEIVKGGKIVPLGSNSIPLHERIQMRLETLHGCQAPRPSVEEQSQLHTDYHNEVGRKYGLARGIPYNELSEEEKRGRKHKNKVVLEAERQAKAALNKVEKYAVLAAIDRKELAFPLLNVKAPVQEAMRLVERELSIPVPAIIGQKAWREERTANINAAIKSLVNAINEARDRQNDGVRTSVNKTYAYYMQNLNRLINENKSFEAENNALKEDNTNIKERISQLDKNAVTRVTAEKDEVISRLKRQLSVAKEELTEIGKDYNALLSKHRNIVLQWNKMKQHPEIIEAMQRMEKRKQEEAAVKREEQAKQYRYQSIIDQFINEGHDALKSFSKTERIDFNKKETNAIYYGIMATASKHHLPLDSAMRVETATDKFLAGMAWIDCNNFRKECVTSWTKPFATKDVVYSEPLCQNFLAFVDYMSCSAETYVSLGGSNGCADQLTNWDGTQKVGLGAPTKRQWHGLSR